MMSDLDLDELESVLNEMLELIWCFGKGKKKKQKTSFSSYIIFAKIDFLSSNLKSIRIYRIDFNSLCCLLEPESGFNLTNTPLITTIETRKENGRGFIGTPNLFFCRHDVLAFTLRTSEDRFTPHFWLRLHNTKIDQVTISCSLESRERRIQIINRSESELSTEKLSRHNTRAEELSK